MNNLNDYCLCLDNPSPPEFACNCSASIIYLCNICVVTHLREPKHHSFIPLDQARKIRADANFNLRVTESQRNFMVFKTQVQAYLARLSSFISYVDSFKSTIIQTIVEEFDNKLNILRSIEADALAKAELMNQSIAASDFSLLEKFVKSGLAGVLESFPEGFKLEVDEIRSIIPRMIHIGNLTENRPIKQEPFLKKRLEKLAYDPQYFLASLNIPPPSPALYPSASNKYLFIPKCCSNTLYAYDPDSNNLSYHDLSLHTPHLFNKSSCFVLIDGSVMIVGGCYPSRGTTLRYNPINFECVKLGDLRTSRGFITLTECEGYIYAFGGFQDNGDCGGEYMNKAERMLMNGNMWEGLPDMNDARSGFGCFVKDSKIYLIGGVNTGRVEYFDTRNMSYSRVCVLDIPRGSNAVGLIDDRVIIIVDKKSYVYSKDFIHIATNNQGRILNPYSLTNKVMRNRVMIFYNSNDSRVYSVGYPSKIMELVEV